MKKKLNKKISIVWVKAIISLLAIIFIVIRLKYPDFRIDEITLGLLVIALLPWFSELIESAKIPGFEVKFRDLYNAGEKVTQGTTRYFSSSSSSSSSSEESDIPEPSYLVVAKHDPNLALVGLRIELEKRVREFADRHNIPDNKSLSRLMRELQNRGILEGSVMSGIQELIYAGNQAAHGASIEQGVAEWAIDLGPEVLAALDEQLKS